MLVYKNAAGTVLAREAFTVVGESNATMDFTREASMQVVPDKQAYKAGDTITLNMQSPYTGTGLITIETDKVHAWKWFTTSSTSSVQTISIPEDFEGKGFINVQFTRDLQSKEIFMSPLSFAVVPFTANIAARDQKVELTVPKEARPGDTVTVEYHSKQPGKIVIYAVDEGILLYHIQESQSHRAFPDAPRAGSENLTADHGSADAGIFPAQGAFASGRRRVCQ